MPKLPAIFSASSTLNTHHLLYGIMSTVTALTYEVGSKSFRPDIQKPRQMENAARDI